MPIAVECSGCGGKFRARDEAAGKRAKCLKCGATIAIPNSPVGTPSAAFVASAKSGVPSRTDQSAHFAGHTRQPPAAAAGVVIAPKATSAIWSEEDRFNRFRMAVVFGRGWTILSKSWKTCSLISVSTVAIWFSGLIGLLCILGTIFDGQKAGLTRIGSVAVFFLLWVVLVWICAIEKFFYLHLARGEHTSVLDVLRCVSILPTALMVSFVCEPLCLIVSTFCGPIGVVPNILCSQVYYFAVDNSGFEDAMNRSWRISWDNQWTVLKFHFLWGLIYAATMMVLSLGCHFVASVVLNKTLYQTWEVFVTITAVGISFALAAPYICTMRALLFTALTWRSLQTRNWADVTGKYAVEAEFVEVRGGIVRLETDGAVISIPIDELRKEDQEYIRHHLTSELHQVTSVIGADAKTMR